MIRTRLALPTALVAAALAISACGGSATPVPSLTDPADIIVSGVKAVQDAKSVHLNVALTGEVPLDLGGLLGGGSGSGAAGGGTFDLTGTTIDGDVDIAGQAAHLTFKLPGLLNLTGEVIVVDGAAYVKASMLGEKYQKFDAADSGLPIPSANPSASVDPAQMEADLRKTIAELSTPPVKLADETCGDTTCYHVQVKLDAQDEGPLASLAPNVTANGTLDLFVRKNDLRPSTIVLTGQPEASSSATPVSATVTLSDWDKSVTITAPPADQVTEGTLPGFPGLPSGLPGFPSPSP